MRRVLVITLMGSILLSACTSSEDSGKTERTATVDPTPTKTGVEAIATEFAGGSSFDTPEEGEVAAGFALLRVDQALFPLTSQLGLVEVFPEVGLPRVRQVLVVPQREFTVDFAQIPDRYELAEPPRDAERVMFGAFEGVLWKRTTDSICFRFATGAMLGDSAIIGQICSTDFSTDDMQRLVEALSF